MSLPFATSKLVMNGSIVTKDTRPYRPMMVMIRGDGKIVLMPNGKDGGTPEERVYLPEQFDLARYILIKQ
jgi:hypothetical protein